MTMLRSIYQREDADAEVARVREKIEPCLAHLRAVERWDRLRECGEDGCVLIPAFAHFFLDEVKLHAAADLAYVHENVLHVIDWKTGRPAEVHPSRSGSPLTACTRPSLRSPKRSAELCSTILGLARSRLSLSLRT